MDRLHLHNLAPPPRLLPLLVRSSVLLGGFLNQFGWLFFGFGLIFFWVFAMNADLMSWYWFRGPVRIARGAVTLSEDTRASEDGTRIYAHHYSFTADDGREYWGVSYALGAYRNQGEEVAVEYPEGFSTRSRIQGMRRAVFGPWAAFVVVFPAVGLGFILAGLRKGRKANHLLAHGTPAFAGLKSKRATHVVVNKRRVYKLTFEFAAQDGRLYQVVSRTSTPEVLEDERQEPLLYDAINPSYALLLDDLPGSPQIDEAGNIRPASPLRAWLTLILPGISILGHGTYAYWRLLA